MSSPGTTPLLIISVLGYGGTCVALLLRGTMARRGLGLLLASLSAASTRAAITDSRLSVVVAGAAIVLGVATVITRGRLELFFDRVDAEGMNTSLPLQRKVLLVSAIPVAVLAAVYWPDIAA